MSAVAGPAMVPASGRNYGKSFHVRKWAYPLTAAAALLILVSVSLMMRGLKSGDMAMDMGASETSGGADLDGGMMAAGAAMDFEGTTETAEDAPADEMISAEAEMAAAPAAEMEDMSESAASVENAESDTAGFSESAKEDVVEKAELEEARENEGQRKFSDTQKNMAEDAVPAESGAQSGDAAETANITIEKVVKKPDFCGRPDTGKHVFEGRGRLGDVSGDGVSEAFGTIMTFGGGAEKIFLSPIFLQPFSSISGIKYIRTANQCPGRNRAGSLPGMEEKGMKKNLGKMIALGMAGVLLLTGCGGNVGTAGDRVRECRRYSGGQRDGKSDRKRSRGSCVGCVRRRVN